MGPDTDKENRKRIHRPKLAKSQILQIKKLIESPEWDAVRVYLEQRALELAGIGINIAQTEQELWFYKGSLGENGLIEKSLKKIVDDYTRQNSSSKNKS